MVKSADRTIKILETIAHSRMGMSHAELARELGIPKSSLTGLLANLVDTSYLVQNGRKYFLGAQIFTLAGCFIARQEIVPVAQPYVSKLMVETGESTGLVVLNGFEILVVCKQNCMHGLRRTLELGERGPIYTTAAGKAILAHSTPDYIDKYLSCTALVPFAKRTIQDVEVLKRELREIRSGAMAYNREEFIDGNFGMAVPVFDAWGKAVAAVCITMPTVRLNRQKEKRFERALRGVAASISGAMGSTQ